jgi:hypothetical protein
MTTKRRIIAGISVAAALAAGAGPASAGQFNVNNKGGYVQVPPKSAVAIEQQRDTTGAPAVVRVTAAGGGLDWGDAAIGAGAGVAISALLLGGGLAVAERRSGGIRRSDGHIRHA